MKFLYYGDLHCSESSPKYRTDDFELTRKEKINEIIEIGKRENVVAFLQGGDFLNSNNISNEYLNQIKEEWGFVDGLEDVILEVLMKNKSEDDLLKAIKRTKRIPTVGIIGNHELIGNNIYSYPNTSLATLVSSGFMRLVTKDNPLILKEDGISVAITGANYNHDIDGNDKSNYIIDNKLADYHIHLVHGMLMDKSYGNKFAHTTIQEIAFKTKANLTINGHDHIGYPLQTIDGKMFVNPGSPVRLSASKKEMNRKPKVLIIEVTKSGITVKDVYLSCAKEGSEVLSREHIIKKELKENKVAEIQTIINKANVGKGLDITQIMNNIAVNKNIKKDILDTAVNSILKEMSKVKSYNPVGAYYIETLEIINFECHEYTLLEFSSGLNILSGESTNGKSSILRALNELYEAKSKNPRDSITYGKTFFKVKATLSNGYQVTRVVENKPKGKNLNGWIVFNPTTGEEEYFNTRGLEKIQEILGLNYIELTSKNKVNINSIMQGKSWFYIGDGLTAPDKAKLLGVPFGTQFADAVLKDVNSASKKAVSEINFIEKDIEKLQNSLDSYKYLDDLNKVLIEASKLQEEIEKLNNNIIDIEKALKKQKEIEHKINIAENVCKVLRTLDSNESYLNEIKSQNERIENIEALLVKRKKIIVSGKTARFVTDKLAILDSLKDDIDLLIKKENEIINEEDILIKSKNLINKNQKISNKINSIDNLIGVLNDVPSIEEIQDIKLLAKSIEDDTVALNRAKEINNSNNNINKRISIAEYISNNIHFEDDVLKDLKNEFDNISRLEKEILKNKNIKYDINEKEKELTKIIESQDVILEEYKKELINVGTCPICHSIIDKKHIDDIISKL